MPEKDQVKKTINFTTAGYHSFGDGIATQNMVTFPRKLSMAAVTRELKKIAGDSLIQKSIIITNQQKVYACGIDAFLAVAHEVKQPANAGFPLQWETEKA